MTKALYFLITILLLTLFYIVYNQNVKTDNQGKQQAAIVIYSKSMCLYCVNAKSLLKSKNIAYKDVDLGENIPLHQKLIQETNQTTVPYIFINGKFIGGYTDLQNLENTNELDLLINAESKETKI